MEQVLYSLPDGWEWQTIEEVAQIGVDRGFVPTPDSEGNVPFIGMTDIDQETGQKSTYELRNFDDVKKGYTKFQRDAVLFAKITPCTENNKTALIDNVDGGFATTEVFPIHALDSVEPKYLLHFFRSPSVRRFLIDHMEGATGRQRVPLKALKSVSVPVCGLKEQKRIVEKLDALLTRIDTAIEHLQSKLDLSKQLFDSVLDEFFKLSDCNSVPLTEVVDFIGGSQPPKSQFSDVQKEGYVRLIQIRDYKTDNHIVYVDSASTKKFCTKEDVMIGRYGPPVFQILRGLDGAYNVALMKAVPNDDVLTKDYLFWFLQSPSIQNYVIGISQRAAGQSGVNKKALEKYLIPVPNKTMQNDIVDKVGQLVDKSRNLEAEVTAEMTSLNQLKASILDSAFKGEL